MSKRNVTIYGAISNKRSKFVHMLAQKTKTNNGIDFFKILAKEYKDAEEEVYVVLDNHPSHGSRDFLESLEGSPFILFKLPCHSSVLNPIERVWGAFKRHWKNHLCEMEGAVNDTNFEEHVNVVLQKIKDGKNYTTSAYKDYQKLLSLNLSIDTDINQDVQALDLESAY